MGSQMKVCAIYNILFTRMNYLWLGNTKETVRQIKVCVIYDIRFTRMNCFRLGNATETVQPDQGVYARQAHVLIKIRMRDGNNERTRLMEQDVC